MSGTNDTSKLDPPKPTVLQEAEYLINGPRRDDYGSALESFQKIATGWEVILGYHVTPEQVALCMDWLKTCRWLNGQQRDSLVDKGGYTGLVDIMQEERKQLSEIKANVASPWPNYRCPICEVECDSQESLVRHQVTMMH